MPTGLLELTATLDPTQLWPSGSSDADTLKVVAREFRFRENDGAPFAVTHAFDQATVVGRVRRKVIDPLPNPSPASGEGQGVGVVTVRLQGVDAPELHYRPPALLPKAERSREQEQRYLQWNLEYRQYFAETATARLRSRLGNDALPCRVVTRVDEPDEPFDAYGRLVGEVLVKVGGEELNLNHWLLREGLAVATFYDSMTVEEIRACLAATREAQANQAGLWPQFKQRVTTFRWKTIYRGSTIEDRRSRTARARSSFLDPRFSDSGQVMMPKLFRRQAAWAVNRRAHMLTRGFATYLRQHPEPCAFTKEFLDAGGSVTNRYGMGQFVYSSGLVSFLPEWLIFIEADANVVGPSGERVSW